MKQLTYFQFLYFNHCKDLFPSSQRLFLCLAIIPSPSCKTTFSHSFEKSLCVTTGCSRFSLYGSATIGSPSFINSLSSSSFRFSKVLEIWDLPVNTRISNTIRRHGDLAD